ncbi:MAG: hypothetical protein A3I43_01300 [Omnitrophica WOR_2 bacterium RIFCSPLOWO2_02_FULL_50_19]|nr:MAG: hypothetical protein A3I43_01300 [Omnitrophica WOR_2 bacterium RIFCSPLOWO2_02_FULL_50_19]
MGIINWLIHRNMLNAANELAKWAFELFQSLRAAQPNIDDRETFRQMLDQRGRFPGGAADREKVLDRYGSSLHGLCYFIGLNSPLMKGMMISRCIQYTQYVDRALEKYGANPLPVSLKREYFEKLRLPVDAAEENRL